MDPDEEEDFLKVVSVCAGTNAASTWRSQMEIFADDIDRMRRRQLMFLARYARQDLLQWDDVDVTKIDSLVEDLMELLKEENGTKAFTENR